MGLLVVMPLWLLYECLRFFYAQSEVNGAELVAVRLLERAGFMNLARCAVALAVLAAAWSIHRREIPWLRIGLVIALEGSVYGLMLGPVAWQLTRHAELLSVVLAGNPLVVDLVGALGAGIFEELVFRLGLLSLLAWGFIRACQAFAIPKWIGVALAVVASALVFSICHHWGDPSALDPGVFVFRSMAGLLLGLLFITRGIGVCVYTHALYNIFLYLQR